MCGERDFTANLKKPIPPCIKDSGSDEKITDVDLAEFFFIFFVHVILSARILLSLLRIQASIEAG